MTLTPGSRLGVYDILNQIGAGGMGEIICHAVPAITLMAAWVFLVWGVWEVFRRDRTISSEGVG